MSGDINIARLEIKEYNQIYYNKAQYLENNSFFKENQKIMNLLPKEFNIDHTKELMKNINLNLLKTSTLFCISSLIPVLINYSEVEDSMLEEIILWANLFGIAFQYSDDILDIDQDRLSNNPNITFIIGEKTTKFLVINILNYLKSNIVVIFKKLNINNNKLHIIFHILDVIRKRCSKTKILCV